jgi:CheY-like chemotaxis protein
MPRLRVLLIDDSRTAQATLGRGLEEAGFEVLVAGDAREALDVLAQRRVSVVLADYQLPGMTGLDLLAVLRGAYPDAPLILYSASMTPELAEQAQDFDVAALPEKPVSPVRPTSWRRSALQRPRAASIPTHAPTRDVAPFPARQPRPSDRPSSSAARADPSRLRPPDRREPRDGRRLRGRHHGPRAKTLDRIAVVGSVTADWLLRGDRPVVHHAGGTCQWQ